MNGFQKFTKTNAYSPIIACYNKVEKMKIIIIGDEVRLCCRQSLKRKQRCHYIDKDPRR